MRQATNVPWLPDRRPAVLAHRGGAALGAENSLDVLALAGPAGADAVEIDVYELGDGTLVLDHDGFVADGTEWLWLRDLDLDRFRSLRGGAATLDDLLARLAPLPLGLYLELKLVTPGGVERAVDAVCESPMRDRTAIGSFRTDIVAAVADDGRLPASILFRDGFVDVRTLAADLGATIVHPCFDDTPGMLDLMAGAWMGRLHDAGLTVVGWNANDAGLLTRQRDVGLDVLCTDDPRLAQPLR